MTTKNPKKVEAGKRLAEYNCRKREELKEQKSKVQPLSQYFCILAVGVIGIGYYLYQAKKGEVTVVHPQQLSHPHPQTNKFEPE